MANFHPNQRMLTDYCDGLLSPASCLIINAHIDMCSECQSKVEQYNSLQAERAFAQEHTDMTPSLESMCNAIVSQPRKPVSQQSVMVSHQDIELNGRKFKLPTPLARLVDKTQDWKRLVGSLWQAPMQIGESENSSFLFMEYGGKVPEHTHKGTELNLVINGSFSDEKATYSNGDFLMFDGDTKHTPMTMDRDGCLIFTVVDKPLVFTSGLARLVNPFSHLFF